MKRKFTFLIAAALMLLTMMATTGTMWGQTTDDLDFSFSNIGSTGWTNSYAQHVVEFDNATVTFASASKQTGTITNYPVTKGQPVSVVLNESTNNITSVTFTCVQWGTKAQTITLHYSTNGGTSYTSTGITSNNFTISSNNLPEGTNAVKITFSSTSNQVGIGSCSVTFESGSSSSLEDSDLALENAPIALEFDLYNNSNAQVINYSTSSTGAVTVSESEFIETEVNEATKTITVTPIAVTSTAQTITVSQVADDNYKAGSQTFTVSITDSTPFAGGDVIFVAGTDIGNSTGQNPDEITKSCVTISSTSAALASQQYRFYKNSVTTISTTSGKITQIVFTHCDNSYPVSNLSNLTDGTWTGEAESVQFTASAQARASQIVVTVAAPTSNPYITAVNVDIDYDVTGGNITYTINNEPNPAGSLTAAIKDGTTPTIANFSLGSITGEAVPFTCGANTESTAHTAEVTLTYTYNTNETVTKDVTITQAADPNATMTIAEVREQATGSVATKGIVTSCVGTTGYIQDATAAICVYGSSLTVGDEIRVSGTLSNYNGLLEITSPEVTVLSSGNTINPVLMTIAEAVASTNQGWYIRIEEATVTEISGQNTTISQGDNTIVVRGISGVTVAVNDVISLNGNIGCYNINQIANPQNIEVQQPTEPTITVIQATVNAPFIGDNGTIDVTYSSFESFDDIEPEAQFFASDGETSATYDWITVTFNDDKDAVYTVDANDGEARTAYFKVYEQSEGIYSNLVTVIQEEYVAPTYAELPFSFDGGKADIEDTDGLSQEGLGGDYGSSPKLKFDGTGDWLLLQFDERPSTLTFDIKGNTFSGGTFTVQTSENGETYTDLKTYTELGDTQNESFDNLGENVRYIKWIYTEKVNGNAALGNIALAAYQEQVATPTFSPAEGEYNEAQSVTIACATEGAAIYYTLDGTEPTNASTLYEEEISVVSTTTIKAIGVKAGLANSEIATATYTITIAPTASIEIEPASLSVDADAHEETFTVAYVSVDADLAEIRTCDEGGNDVSYDWFSATFASTTDHNNITCTIAANDGDARTAYFLVHVSGNVFSDIIAVSQEAYVVPPTPVTEGWVLTDLADLAEGDVFVIVGDNGSTYAMSNDNGTSSAPAAVEVTVSNYALSEEPAENLKWNLTIADGTYTFYPNGDTEKWLYCTNTNNGVRVGTNDNKTFTISNGYLFNSGTSRYVGIYNSQDWRCYTSITGSSNIKDQTFAFYKYVENPTAPKITLSSYSIATPATETIEMLTITPANIENFDVNKLSANYCNPDGSDIDGSKPDFVAFDFSENEGYKLTCTISDNDGDARTAYFKVIYELGENDYVYSNVVTVNQEAYVAPVATITVNPAEINIDANENIEELGVTVANISSIDLASFNIDYCNLDGSEIEGDKPDIIDDYEFTANTPEEGYTLTITFKANEGDARTAYFKVKYELGENDYVYSNVVAVNQESTEVVGVTYELVVSTDDIVPDSYYLITSGTDGSVKAMAGQNTNNRAAVNVTVSNNVITNPENVVEFLISGSGTELNPYTIYDENYPGYLYAAGTSSANYLKTQAEINARAQWTITINNSSQAIITALTDETDRKIMRYNSSSDVFSCYGSGQQPIYLFKKVDNSPSISADNVDIEYNATSGSIIYEIDNYVAGEMAATTEADWISVFTYEQVDEIGTVSFTTTTNASYVSRSATVTLTYSYGDPAATVTKDVTVTQAAAPIPTYIVSFIVGEGGTFVPNDDFDDEMVEVEAGTYTLPSATKEGYTFDGWNDGEQTYAAGVEYTVSYDVAFTATYTELQHITIHFVVNGEADNDMDVLQGTPVELPLTSTLTPDGFAITGWSSEPSSTVAVPNPYTPESEVTLYALLTYLYSEDSFELVTDASDLADGDIVVIAALNSDYAMSTTQNNNNRGQAAIVKSGNQIALSENVCEFVLGEGSTENTWSFYDAVNEGYIYAASSSSNYLRTETELSANSSWTISIEENAATITAQGSNTHNFMQYNSSSSIFSCYASGTTTQQPICIYKKNEASSFNYVNSITEPDAILDTNIPESTCYVVEDGAVLTFTGTNEGTAANLVVQEGGQLIHESDVEATVQKGISAYSTKSGDGWYLIASPVDNYSTSTIATGTYDLFIYNEPNAYWYSSTGAAAPFNTLERGKGYLYANAADVNLNYAGTMKATNANIKVDLSYACDEYPYLKGFNLVGNPFTRNITAADMVIGDTAVTSYYDFNADRTEFVTYQTIERPIQPGQGFFIQAKGNAQQLEFNPATSKDASDFKYISISAGDENFTDKAYIQFGYGNTLRKMTFGENTMVYVMNNDDDYAAARVEELAGTMPVHFVPIEDGFYTITVETKNIENLNYMHLIDNIKNTEIDLLVEPSYTFKASESDNADRFYLVFDFNNYTGVNENYTNDNFAHQIGDEIFVSGEGTLQVFDVLGRFVTGYNVNGDKRISTAEFNTGVYIFRMVGTEVKTQKIIVR